MDIMDLVFKDNRDDITNGVRFPKTQYGDQYRHVPTLNTSLIGTGPASIANKNVDCDRERRWIFLMFHHMVPNMLTKLYDQLWLISLIRCSVNVLLFLHDLFYMALLTYREKIRLFTICGTEY